ncbi:hypothetical protein TanjilG_02375 [Lupinus angustifolius]|uniref:Glycosyl hydrolase family 32 N-terminal domain-containing protein n=1 Tax=Lupinus angustifolius TaxID=3871 RepID=A0A1J7GNQ4_LUPAN|nr:hypothetical protein TanjilG_02375 [Lupinus angustifolius]
MEASSSMAFSSLIPRISLSKVSNFQCFTNPTTLIPSWVSSTTVLNTTLTFVSSNTKKFPPFIPCCSTQPDTSANSGTHSNPNNELNSLSNASSESDAANKEAFLSSSLYSCSSLSLSLSRGLVFDLGPSNSWDNAEIGSPKKGEFAIGIASSRDGIRWLKLGKIMGGGKAGSFNEFGVMNPCVTRNRRDGNYFMAYEGVAADGRSIGMAVSPDGLREWTRLHDEAILKPLDKGCWDDKDVGSPCLVQMDIEASKWRLYYRGVGNRGRVGIGMANYE